MLSPGDNFGGCRLDRLAGCGGMGEVWVAHEPDQDRPVAVKVLRSDLVHDDQAIARFAQEARVMEPLVHPHILRLFRTGEDQGRLFFVMEFIEGGSLADKLLREGTLPLREARVILAQMIEGLSYAADRGITHRDVKPANVLLKWGTDVKVTDFGIARFLGADNRGSAGMCMGSPYTMSPEQVLGLEADLRADIYSLGITLYQMLVGQVPFTGPDAVSILKQHVLRQLPEAPGLERLAKGALLPLLRKMTAKSPAERFQSYDELQFAITQLASVSEADAPLPQPLSRARLSTDAAEAQLADESWGRPTVAKEYVPEPETGESPSSSVDLLATFHELPTLVELLDAQDGETLSAMETIRMGSLAATGINLGGKDNARIAPGAVSISHVPSASLGRIADYTGSTVTDAVRGGRSALVIGIVILVSIGLLAVVAGLNKDASGKVLVVNAEVKAAAAVTPIPERERREQFRLVSRSLLPAGAPRADDVLLGTLRSSLLGNTPSEVVDKLGAPEFKEVSEIEGQLFYDATQWTARIVDSETSQAVFRVQVTFQRDRCVAVGGVP